MAPRQPDHFILASTSPRRRDLLTEAGYRFRVVAPRLEEPPIPAHFVDPISHAESTAFFKAGSLAESHSDAVILGADTIAVIEQELIGKPTDRADARRILRRLSDTEHRVITGVALLHPATGRRSIQHAVTTLRVRPLDEAMIEAYLDTGAWEGKAGAYGIQDRDDPFVVCAEGSFTNVVGLPMELLGRMMAEFAEFE